MKDYTRKVFAFAYAKTGNVRDAEDLSQDIILEILRGDISAARDPDAWVSGVCRHVWARYLNRNKPHWEAMNAAPVMEFIASEEKGFRDVEKQAEYEELRREIAYLGRTRREVLIMYYFDGLKVEEIARRLNVEPVTVRWHMSKARTELKGRLNMENRNGMREQVKLDVGIAGDIRTMNMAGLFDDLLTQNVAWACHGKKLSVEEISRELGVPAVYLEPILERRVDNDYISESNGKYTTNFFIASAEYQNDRNRYIMENIAGFAQKAHDAAREMLSKARPLGFGDMPDEELIWYLLPELLRLVSEKTLERVKAAWDLTLEYPLRADGTHHQVWARVKGVSSGDTALDEFAQGSRTSGVVVRSAGRVSMLEMKLNMLGQAHFLRDEDLEVISCIMKNGGEVEEYLKETAAKLADEGYAVIEDGKLNLLVPYMTKAQHDEFARLLNNAADELMDISLALCDGLHIILDRHMPKFLKKADRDQWYSDTYFHGETMWYLVKNGQVELPAESAANRTATLIWEAK